jgi:hypothetical protein
VVGTDNLAVQGFLAGGDANGSTLMAQLVSQATSQCPKSKVVVSGYSQGGQLVHNAAKMLKASTSAAVSSGMALLSLVLLLLQVVLGWCYTDEKWLSSATQTTVRQSQASLLRRR